MILTRKRKQIKIASVWPDLSRLSILLAPSDLEARFEAKGHRLILLHFLLSTLMSARLTDTTGVQDSSKSVQSSTTGQLEGALAALNIGKPPPNVTPGQFFAQLCAVIEKINANDRKVKTVPSKKTRRIECLPDAF